MHSNARSRRENEALSVLLFGLTIIDRIPFKLNCLGDYVRSEASISSSAVTATAPTTT
jgi:hypothetical protein